MSFERLEDFGDMEIICDVCGSNDILDADFDTSLQEAKNYGWIIRRIDGEWMHFCGTNCYEKFKGKQK